MKALFERLICRWSEEEERYECPASWRMLRVGEVVQEGDEFSTNSGRWLPSAYQGYKIEKQDVGHYRRLNKTTKQHQ